MSARKRSGTHLQVISRTDHGLITISSSNVSADEGAESSSPFGGVLTVSSAAGQESGSHRVSGAEMYLISSDHGEADGQPGRSSADSVWGPSGPARTWGERHADASLARCHMAPTGKRPRPRRGACTHGPAPFTAARVRRMEGAVSQAHPSHRVVALRQARGFLPF